MLVGEATYRATHGAIEYGERRAAPGEGQGRAGRRLRGAACARRAAARVEAAAGAARRPQGGAEPDPRHARARAPRAHRCSWSRSSACPGSARAGSSGSSAARARGRPGARDLAAGTLPPYGDGVTFWALGEMVKAQAGDPRDATTSTTAEAKLAARGRATWSPTRARPRGSRGTCGRCSALDAPSAGGAAREAFAAWRRVLRGARGARPLVLVFEDLHWADDGLLDFLDHLADWATSAPLVLLCTARPELRERRPTWGARANAVDDLALSADATTRRRALVGFLLDQRSFPAELADGAARARGGEPALRGGVRAHAGRPRLLDRDGGGWQLRDRELPVPESVQAIIAARLDALQPDEKARAPRRGGDRPRLLAGRGRGGLRPRACGRRRRASSARAKGARPARAHERGRGRAPVLVPPRARPRRRLRADPARRARGEAPARRGVDRVARPARGPRGDDRAPLPARARVRARRRPGRLVVRGSGAESAREAGDARARAVRARAGGALLHRGARALAGGPCRARPSALLPRQGAPAGGGGIAELEEASEPLLEVGDGAARRSAT